MCVLHKYRLVRKKENSDICALFPAVIFGESSVDTVRENLSKSLQLRAYSVLFSFEYTPFIQQLGRTDTCAYI